MIVYLKWTLQIVDYFIFASKLSKMECIGIRHLVSRSRLRDCQTSCRT